MLLTLDFGAAYRLLPYAIEAVSGGLLSGDEAFDVIAEEIDVLVGSDDGCEPAS